MQAFLFSALIGAALTATSFATAQQKAPLPHTEQLSKQQVEGLLNATNALTDAIRKAVIALESIEDKAGADAAADAVLAVMQEHENFRAYVPKEDKFKQLWKQTPLYGRIRKMPAALYNELIRKELAELCHGSVKLAVAIAGRSGEFSEEQMAAPLSERDSATLRRVEEHVFARIKQLSSQPQLTDAFLAEVEATQAGVEQLQQTPAGLMHWLCLKERYRRDIDNFRQFYRNGKLIERFILQRSSYIADFYSDDAHHYFFLYYDDHLPRHTGGQAMRDKLWQEAAPRLAEFRKTHKLSGGDGLTPDTAFELPPDLPPAQRREYINTFVREVFGEQHMTHAPYSALMPVLKPGKYPLALRVPIIVGMLQESGHDYYHPIIITNAYFYTTGN